MNGNSGGTNKGKVLNLPKMEFKNMIEDYL